MTYYACPNLASVRLIIVYSLAHKKHGYNHVGLGVGGMHSIRVLRKRGIRADLYGVQSAEEFRSILQKTRPTHCVVEAPWVPTAVFEQILAEFPATHFVMRIHSQVGFLQVEAGAIKLLREQLVLQEQAFNFTVAANSTRLAKYLEHIYGARCLYLPNLYDLERVHRKEHRPHGHRTLRIGLFGATRILKNLTTGAASALEIARWRQSDLELSINVNREEHGKGVVQAIRNMMSGLTWAKLKEVEWSSWSDFCRCVQHQDLNLQPSFTETFNIVSADSVAAGVPVVVTDAIEWAPEHWKAEPDSVESIARTGAYLLNDGRAGQDGLRALATFEQEARRIWLRYLRKNPT